VIKHFSSGGPQYLAEQKDDLIFLIRHPPWVTSGSATTD